MNKKILIGITAIIALFLIYQGSKNQKTINDNQLASLAKAAKPTERPRDPWVFRSVLNEKPRMITIALNDRLWVAYDTQYGSIYKAWYGGVDFNGAVYTTSHGPQPTSQGSSYINGLEDDNVWYLDGKKIEDEDFSFKGYSLLDNAVVLSYEINNSESGVIKILERPEMVVAKSGSLALKRIFEVQNAQNTKVELETPIQSILDTNGFSTNAPYTLEQISTSSYEWGEKINYIAKISLNKKQKTTVTTFFDLRVGEESAAKEEVKKTVPLEPQADINFSNKKINIDGQIDESWFSEEYLKIDNLIYGENEIEGAFKMLWDNESLYILHKITDSNVTELDGIDFFIDSKRERGSEYDSNDSYYSLIMEDLAKLDVSNTKTNAKIIVRQSEEGYIVESSIPWSDLNVNPFDGMKMGFSTHLNNVGSSTSSKYSWRSVSNDLFENPASFASIKLIDQKNNSIETNREGFAKGILVNMYKVGVSLSNVPEVVENQNPNISKIMPSIDHLSERGSFHGINDSFVINAKAFINIQEEGEYEFRITSDDGSKLHVNNELLIENDDLQGPTPKNGKVTLAEGIHEIFIEHFENTGGEALLLEWKRPNSSDFEIITRESLFVKGDSIMETDDEIKDVIIKSPINAGVKKAIPGDGSILTDVHPSYDLFTARPEAFEPKVGGMDWLPDGRLIICNWKPDGGVYLLDGIQGDDRENITVKRIAAGLAEPLGVKVVDGRIFVLQKQELTELIDHDGDEVIDEYKTIANGWGVTSNFHEFAFGLVYKDGYFYGTLATAINPGGASTQPQNHDRGTVVKISMDGNYEFIARGLRTPNGIGLGVDGEIFVADNQGDWLPSSKIVHISEGAFLGNRSVRPEIDMDLKEKPPLVWLPQNEIGNSPSTPSILNDGPYAGQMMHGEVTHGGLKRVFVEKVNGEYQGALFRFTQGLEAGVNRLTIGPDGGIYIGGIGNGGNWGQAGKEWFGLQRLKYNGKTTFEMLAIRIKNNGMEIEFTEPLSEASGNDAEDYSIQQFWYKPTEKYGGPKMDLEDLEVKSVTIDESRTKAFLQIEGLKEGHVVYFKLNSHMKNNDGERLWTTESWYTLNNMPLIKQGEKND